MSVHDDSSSLTATLRAVARSGSFQGHGVRAADAFDSWLFAETDATLALNAWLSADSAHKGDAYSAYMAAADREAAAAHELERWIARAAA